MTDRDLLAAYQTSRSAQVFAQIVNRYVNVVYSVARRQVKDTHVAEDITQEVFITLLGKAPGYDLQSPLVAWLFVTTRLLVLQTHRAATRRDHYEREAAMTQDASITPDPTWPLIADEVDKAVADLAPQDRDAILLRYFAGKSNEEIAADLAISEEAAKKRGQRALESLRGLLMARGLTVPAAGLAAALTVHAVAEAAPPAVAAAILQASLLSVPTTFSAGSSTLKGILMTVKLKTALAVAVVALVIGIPAVILAVWRSHSAATAPSAVPADTPPVAIVPIGADVPIAPSQPSEELAEFESLYRLKPGQAMAHIPPPFATSRTAGYNLMNHLPYNGAKAFPPRAAADPRMASLSPSTLPSEHLPPPPPGGDNVRMRFFRGGPDGAVEVPPSAMLMKWQDGKPLDLQEGINGSPSFPDRGYLLKNLLGIVFKLQPYDIEGSPKDEIPGDFIFRAGATEDQLRAAFEQVLTNFHNQPITLSFRQVQRPVYILRGKWDYKPLFPQALGETPNIHLYSVDTEANFGTGNGVSEVLASALISELNALVVVQAQGLPPVLRYTNHDDPSAAVSPKALLDHVAAQTGLTWTEETRAVRRLFVEN